MVPGGGTVTCVTTRQSVTVVVVLDLVAGCRSGWSAAGKYTESVSHYRTWIRGLVTSLQSEFLLQGRQGHVTSVREAVLSRLQEICGCLRHLIG
jgi:hypothetical protein